MSFLGVESILKAIPPNPKQAIEYTIMLESIGKMSMILKPRI